MTCARQYSGYIITFSERETARFGAPTLTTAPAASGRSCSQMTATVLVTAPIMCVGGIIAASRGRADIMLTVPAFRFWLRNKLLDHPTCRSSAACRA